MTSIGWATLSVIPSMRGFQSAVERGSTPALANAGKTGASAFGDAYARGTDRTMRDVNGRFAKGAAVAGSDSGAAYGEGFTRDVNGKLRDANGRFVKDSSAAGSKAGSAAGRAFNGDFARHLKRGAFVGGLAAFYGAGSFIKDSVKLEAEFGKTMAQMAVATDAPQDQLKRMDALAITLGKDTIFSANEASTAMLELAKNGIKPATIEGGALKSALTLAAAGGVDLTDAATTMGNALNAFGLKGKQAESVAAALAGAANASSASVGSLSEGLQQVSAVAADSGFNIQETAGALAAFANAGIGGSDAGTSLKTMFARLVPTTRKAKDTMKAYGLMAYDASAVTKVFAETGLKSVSNSYADVTKAVSDYLVEQGVATEGTAKLANATEDYLIASGIMRSDFLKSNGDFKNLASIAGELDEAFSKLSDSERGVALNDLFGSDARRAATVLMNEGVKGIEKYTKATSDRTQADKLAEANMSGTAGAMERLAGAWETTKLEFGKSIAPVAADFLEGLSGTLDDLSPKLATFGDWFTKTGGPAIADFAGQVKDLVSAFNDLPSEVKKLGFGALLAGGAAIKLRGGGGGLVGSAGKALGLARPIPVFVTNPGGIGGLGGKAPGAAPPLIAGAKAGTLAGLTKGASLSLGRLVPFLGIGIGGDRGVVGPDGETLKIADEKRKAALLATIREDADQTNAKFDALISKAGLFGDELDLVGNKKVDPSLTIRGMDKARGDLQKFLGQQIEARKPITPYVTLTGYDRAMQQIKTLSDAIHAVPSAGVDNGVPYVGGAGVVNNFTGPITATDTKDITRQAQRKMQQRGLGGRP